MKDFLRFDGAHATQAEIQYHSPEMVQQREHLRALLALSPGQRVLDIGCGPGILAKEMAREVGPTGEVCGIDVSESMLALAEQRCGSEDRVTLRPGRAESIPFGNEEFDATIAVQVYEYVPDVERALAELFRVLRPGGRAVILDTDWDSLVWYTEDRARMRGILELWDGHLADPRLPERLGYLLSRAGFEEESLTTLTFLNRECHEGTYSFWLIGFVESFVGDQGGVSLEETRAWGAELRALAREQRYFFSLDRYVFTVRRPER
ncbi:MAG TPA: methyltransferase domain-containing protein [Pseudonocardiaceae bacterium]|nr:methyltransferase domain-containing protein [Pseudonocardiaceae bacterium]